MLKERVDFKYYKAEKAASLLSQLCRNDSYSKWFSDGQILVQISDDCGCGVKEGN